MHEMEDDASRHCVKQSRLNAHLILRKQQSGLGYMCMAVIWLYEHPIKINPPLLDPSLISTNETTAQLALDMYYITFHVLVM